MQPRLIVKCIPNPNVAYSLSSYLMALQSSEAWNHALIVIVVFVARDCYWYLFFSLILNSLSVLVKWRQNNQHLAPSTWSITNYKRSNPPNKKPPDCNVQQLVMYLMSFEVSETSPSRGPIFYFSFAGASFEKMSLLITTTTVMSSEVYPPGVLGFRLVSQTGGYYPQITPWSRAACTQQRKSPHQGGIMILASLVRPGGILARSGGILPKTSL